MIQVTNLRKRFGAVQAVDDISFTAPDGRITGILGENGAGKTTTLSVICGLVPPDAGVVQLDGDERSGLERRRRLARTSPISARCTACPATRSRDACRRFLCCSAWRPSPTGGRPVTPRANA
jgi:ABC-type cobalamin/Fe3+-siderophores transport system ATPase subunit